MSGRSFTGAPDADATMRDNVQRHHLKLIEAP